MRGAATRPGAAAAADTAAAQSADVSDPDSELVKALAAAIAEAGMG